MAQRVLGLDIGRAAIKGVVLETSIRTYELVGFHSEPIGVEPNAEAETRKAALQAALFHLMEKLGPVDQIITALPGDTAASTTLEMPFSDPAKLDKTLAFQLDDLTPFDVDDLLIDYQFIERSKGPSKLLVGSAPKERIGEFLEELQEVQIDPRVLMIDGLPYFHLFGQATSMPHTPMWGVLDIGYQQTTLTIFRTHPEDPQAPYRVEMVRSLSRGTRHLRAGLAQKLGVDEEQADDLMLLHLNMDPHGPSPNPQVSDAVAAAMTPLLMELRRTLTAVHRKLHLPIEHLYLCGGGAMLNGIDGFLGQRLGIEVHPMSADQLSHAPEIEWPAAHYTYLKALGLALRSMDNRNAYARINLRKTPFAFKGDLQYLKDRMGSLVAMAAILIVLLGASIFTSFYVRSVEGKRLENEVQKRCRQIIGRSGLSPRKCLGIMDDVILKVKGTGGQSLVPKISAYDMLLVFYKRISDLTKNKKIRVEIGLLSITPNRFVFEGETNSYIAVDKIEQQLKGYHCFRNLKRQKAQISSSNTKKIEFRLSAKLGC